MTTLLKRTLWGLLWLICSLIGLVILLYLLLVVVNWRDSAPSATALEMARLIDERPAVPDDDNAFLYLLGFSVDAQSDPQQEGMIRRDWLEAANHDRALAAEGADFEDETLDPADHPTWHVLREKCPRDAQVECRRFFEHLSRGPALTEVEVRYLTRYREIIQRKGWREVVYLDFSLPLPRYADVLRAQMLMMLDLRRRAGPGAAQEIRAALHADLEFWREVQRSSDLLITKMIAVAALRQHFFLGNLVLRALPVEEQLAAIPEGWSREFGRQELAMHRAMAGELRFVEALTRGMLTPEEMVRASDDPFREPHQGHRIIASLAEPLYLPQHTVNRLAAQYKGVADRFDVPLTRYTEVREKLDDRKDEQGGFPWTLRNPLGNWFSTLSDEATFASYAPRVGALEGMRRAALLTARLRGARVPAEQVASRLNDSPLRNPFDQEPLVWEEALSAIVFDALHHDTTPRKHVYFY